MVILGKSAKALESKESEIHTHDRYLTTLAAAEQLYDALYQIDRLGYLEIDTTSLPFFQIFNPLVATGKYPSSSAVYSNITSAIRTYADGFLDIVAKYASSDGSLAEQYSRDDGSPLSAFDLTWCMFSLISILVLR